MRDEQNEMKLWSQPNLYTLTYDTRRALKNIFVKELQNVKDIKIRSDLVTYDPSFE